MKLRDYISILVKPRQPYLGVGIILLFGCFLFFVYPTPYQLLSTKRGTDLVFYRVNRFTGIKQVSTDTGWKTELEIARSTGLALSEVYQKNKKAISQEEVERIKGNMKFEYAGSTFFKGAIYNGNIHDLDGEVIFHILIKNDKGMSLLERDYRETISCPAQQTRDIIIKTDFAFEEGNTVEWKIVPVQDNATNISPMKYIASIEVDEVPYKINITINREPTEEDIGPIVRDNIKNSPEHKERIKTLKKGEKIKPIMINKEFIIK